METRICQLCHMEPKTDLQYAIAHVLAFAGTFFCYLMVGAWNYETLVTNKPNTKGYGQYGYWVRF